jgi:hypothetical protein
MAMTPRSIGNGSLHHSGGIAGTGNVEFYMGPTYTDYMTRCGWSAKNPTPPSANSW